MLGHVIDVLERFGCLQPRIHRFCGVYLQIEWVYWTTSPDAKLGYGKKRKHYSNQRKTGKLVWEPLTACAVSNSYRTLEIIHIERTVSYLARDVEKTTYIVLRNGLNQVVVVGGEGAIAIGQGFFFENIPWEALFAYSDRWIWVDCGLFWIDTLRCVLHMQDMCDVEPLPGVKTPSTRKRFAAKRKHLREHINWFR